MAKVFEISVWQVKIEASVEKIHIVE